MGDRGTNECVSGEHTAYSYTIIKSNPSAVYISVYLHIFALPINKNSKQYVPS